MLMHLCVSLLVILGIIVFVKLAWFPSVFFHISGAMQGIQILFYVDLVLGPLLTFAVCSPVKSSAQLARDLSVIVVLQCIGLGGGVHVLSNTKPLAVVYVYDTFHVVRGSDYEALGVDTNDLKHYPGSSPKMFYVPTYETQSAFLIGEVLDKLNKKMPKFYNLDLYQPFPTHRRDRQRVLNIGEGETLLADQGNCLERRIQSIFHSGIICYDIASGKLSQFVEDEYPSFNPAKRLDAEG